MLWDDDMRGTSEQIAHTGRSAGFSGGGRLEGRCRCRCRCSVACGRCRTKTGVATGVCTAGQWQRATQNKQRNGKRAGAVGAQQNAVPETQASVGQKTRSPQGRSRCWRMATAGRGAGAMAIHSHCDLPLICARGRKMRFTFLAASRGMGGTCRH